MVVVINGCELFPVHIHCRQCLTPTSNLSVYSIKYVEKTIDRMILTALPPRTGTVPRSSKSRALRHLFLMTLIMLMFSGCIGPYPWEERTAQQRAAEARRVLESLTREAATPGATRAPGVQHTVKRGETLWRIARMYDVDVQALAELNGIADPGKIEVGQQIFIPGATKPKEAPIKPAEPEPAPASTPTIVTDTGTFAWPVRGRIISEYGVRNGLRYEGIEISAPEGTPVCAANSGEVIYNGSLKGYGNVLIIKHNNDFKTVYAYNHDNLVTEGREVTKGETIATVGKSSRTNHACLHFQVRKKDEPRNPRFFLP